MFQAYDEVYFVTLTFTDECLSSLSERTRHRYVIRWANSCCRDYFGNIDYGSQKHREHYHIVCAFNCDSSQAVNNWPYGFSSVKKVVRSPKDANRVSTYLLKLTNHAGKVGTGRIFSKKIQEDIDNLPF